VFRQTWPRKHYESAALANDVEAGRDGVSIDPVAAASAPAVVPAPLAQQRFIDQAVAVSTDITRES
jgi:hypothetical protein